MGTKVNEENRNITLLAKLLIVVMMVSTMVSAEASYALTPDDAAPQKVKPAGIVRLEGENRYGTSNLVSKEFMKEKGGEGKLDHIILTTGTGFKDSLSGSFLAAQASTNILIFTLKGAKKV